MKHLINHTFVQADLDLLISQAVHRYQNADTFGNVVGAVESLFEDYPSQFLDAYTAKLAEGYTRHGTLPVEFLQRNGTQFYRCYLVKPEHIQDADIAVITEQVTADYKAELQRRYNDHLQLLVDESVAMAERATAKKAEAARAKLVEEATAAAVKALGEFHA